MWCNYSHTKHVEQQPGDLVGVPLVHLKDLIEGTILAIYPIDVIFLVVYFTLGFAVDVGHACVAVYY